MKSGGWPFQASQLFLAGLRSTPQALLQHVRDVWTNEGWHWIRGTQLHEDSQRYRGMLTGAMPTLRTAVLNLLWLAGLCLIGAGIQAVTQDITGLLPMAR